MGMGPWDEAWGEAYDDIWGYGAKTYDETRNEAYGEA